MHVYNSDLDERHKQYICSITLLNEEWTFSAKLKERVAITEEYKLKNVIKKQVAVELCLLPVWSRATPLPDP